MVKRAFLLGSKRTSILFFLAASRGMADLSSLIGDGTEPPAVEAQSRNHWTARKVPGLAFLYFPRKREVEAQRLGR